MRYAGVGVINTVVGFSTIAILTLIGVNPLLANALGFLVGGVLGYVLNGMLTFEVQFSGRQFSRYAVATIGCFLFNLFIVYYAIWHFGVATLFAQLLGMLAFSISHFIICKSKVFR